MAVVHDCPGAVYCTHTSDDGPAVRFDHIYLPAKKPDWLAEWYAETFGFKAEGGLVVTGSVVLVFQEGDPSGDRAFFQFGFRAESQEQLGALANQLGVELRNEGQYSSFEASDPEGYRFQVYWEAE